MRELGNADASPKVEAKPRFFHDLKALEKFFERDTPVELTVRASQIVEVIYHMGDASGGGFGDAFDTTDGLSIHIGKWSYQESDSSSNYKEFKNPMDALRREGEAGRLSDAFVLLATDNATIEREIYNRTSSLESLLELVIE